MHPVRTLKFNEQEILSIEQDGGFYAALKPICENIGLDWPSQRQRILRQPVLSSVVVMITTTGSDGKSYRMMMLPIDYLNGWLFSVDIHRVKRSLKDKLIAYQRECFRALDQYWRDDGTRRYHDHAFLEITRGRLLKSPKGVAHNTVSPNTATLLKYCYDNYGDGQWHFISYSGIGRELGIDRTCVSRSLRRIADWRWINLETHSRRLKLHRSVLEGVLEENKTRVLLATV